MMQNNFVKCWENAKPGTTFEYEICADRFYCYKPTKLQIFKSWLRRKFNRKNYIYVAGIDSYDKDVSKSKGNQII